MFTEVPMQHHVYSSTFTDFNLNTSDDVIFNQSRDVLMTLDNDVIESNAVKDNITSYMMTSHVLKPGVSRTNKMYYKMTATDEDFDSSADSNNEGNFSESEHSDNSVFPKTDSEKPAFGKRNGACRDAFDKSSNLVDLTTGDEIVGAARNPGEVWNLVCDGATANVGASDVTVGCNVNTEHSKFTTVYLSDNTASASATTDCSNDYTVPSIKKHAEFYEDELDSERAPIWILVQGLQSEFQFRQ